MDVEIRTLPDTRVAYMRHTGPYGSPSIATLWPRFIAWSESRGLMPPRRDTFGVSHDDPMKTPPEQQRYDACIVVDDAFEPPPDAEVGIETIGGGRYACAMFRGGPMDVPVWWRRFMSEMLPAAGLVHDGRPVFELYDEDFEMDPATGTFACRLCAPIQ